MKLYALWSHVNSEGPMLLGVFQSRDHALGYAARAEIYADSLYIETMWLGTPRSPDAHLEYLCPTNGPWGDITPMCEWIPYPQKGESE